MRTNALRATMVQLDGLRALAVALVLLQHYAPASSWLLRAGPGGLGVSLFFVLSGFLLTGILLDERPADEAPRGPVLRVFYLRRFLRILPLYYAVLFTSAALDVAPVRRSLGWHLAYLSNVYFVRRGAWDGPVTPLWSLAVEEQFYALWPALLYAVSRRHGLRLCVALVGAGPLVRALIVARTGPSPMLLAYPFASVDLFAFGALLAHLHRAGDKGASLRRAPVRAAVWIVLVLLVLLAFAPVPAGRLVASSLYVLHPSAVAFVSFALVDAAARGLSGPVGALLASGPLRRLGAVSYSVYLLHAFVHFAAYGLCRVPGLRWLRGPFDALRASGWGWFPVACATTVLAANVTYVLLEQPVNALKRRLPYPPARPAGDG